MFGPYALFPPAGYLDPWFYPGYFTNFSYLLSHYGLTYYVSRLPWILPGLAAFAIASPPVASLLLCSAIVAVSATSLYWAVRWHYGPVPGVLAATALATNPYFMATAAWHYPDGPAIAYAMAGMALYLRPHGNRTLNSVLAAGALALAGFTNMSSGLMILSVLVIPFWHHRHSLKRLAREAVCAAAAVAVTTLVLMKVSKDLLGDSLFFLPQIKMWMYTRQTPGYFEKMWGTGPGFLPRSPRVFLPVFLLAFGAAFLIAIRKRIGPAWAAYLAALTCFLLYSLDQFLLHGVTLRVHYHSSYMAVPMFGFAGTALGELWKRRPGGLAAGAMLTATALALPMALNRWRPDIPPAHIWMGLACIGAAGIVLGILAHRPSLPLQNPTCALLLVAVFVGPAFDAALGYVWAAPEILHGSNLSSGKNADAYRCLMDLENYLKANVDANRSMQFWWTADEPLSNLYVSAAAMNLQGFQDLDKELTTGPNPAIQQLFQPNKTLIHLTMYSARIQERARWLASRGVVVEGEGGVEMQFQGKRFFVSLQDVTAPARP